MTLCIVLLHSSYDREGEDMLVEQEEKHYRNCNKCGGGYLANEHDGCSLAWTLQIQENSIEGQLCSRFLSRPERQ